MKKNAWMKELAEDVLPNSKVEILALKMKTEQDVQLSVMMSSLWYQLKNWQWSFVQTIQPFIVIFNNLKTSLNLEKGCLMNFLKSTANPDLTSLHSRELISPFWDRIVTGDENWIFFYQNVKWLRKLRPKHKREGNFMRRRFFFSLDVLGLQRNNSLSVANN